MCWLDWLFVVAIGAAALRGYFRGFVVEACTLLAWLVGIWTAIHLSNKVGAWIGLGPDRQVLAFGITFLLVLVGVHLVARAITKALDATELSVPNKAMGTVFGALRSAFVLSVLLNVASALPEGGIDRKLQEASEGSALYGPVRGFAPMLVPALKKTKWVRRAIEEVEQEKARLIN